MRTPFRIFADTNVLGCPHCGSGNLHQVEVGIVARTEDADGALIRVDQLSGATTREEIKANDRRLSGRRQELVVVFACEYCDLRPTLHMHQHKGETIVHWGTEVPSN